MRKQHKIVMPIMIIILTITACGGAKELTFPEFSELSYMRMIEDETNVIDYYIQATPSMYGFVGKEDSAYVKTVSLLDSPLLYQVIEQKERNFFRFDISNIDLASSGAFYEIDSNQFFYDALDKKEDFYSLKWLLEHPKYGKAYENMHGKSTDFHIYQSYYIAPVIYSLDEESLSVVITDLLDYDLDGREIIDAVYSKVKNNDDYSITILGIYSEYSGTHQLIGRSERAINLSNIDGDEEIGSEVNGRRPFYVLIMGQSDAVEQYSTELGVVMDMEGVEYEIVSVLKNTSTDTNYGLVEKSTSENVIRVTDSQEIATEGEYAEQEFIYRLKSGSEYGILELEQPFDLSSGEMINRDSFQIRYTLEGLEISSESEESQQQLGRYYKIDESNKELYLCLSDEYEEGEKSDVVINNNIATLKIVIDKEKLKKYSIGDADKFRLTVDIIENSEIIEIPDWIHEFNFNGNISDFKGNGTPHLNNIILASKQAAIGMPENERSVARTKLYLICQ